MNYVQNKFYDYFHSISIDSCPSKSFQQYAKDLNWTLKDQNNAIKNSLLQQNKVSSLF